MYFDKESFMQPSVAQYGSHMVMTNVQKETRRKYINIDTRFRDDYNDMSHTNHWEHLISLPVTFTDIKSIMVRHAEIPMSFYNISASLGNNGFLISNSLISAAITLADGNYSAADLQVAINKQLKVAIPQVSFSVSNIIDASFNGSYTNYMATFTNAGPSQVTINFAVTGGVCGSSGIANDKYNVKGKLGWMLGFHRQPQVVIAGSGSVTSAVGDSVVDLNGPRYLYLIVDEFSKGNQNSFISPLSASFINKNILARINLDKQIYPFGSILPANLYSGSLVSDIRSYNGKIDIQRMKVQLVNEYGNPVNLCGLDFSFCLEMEYE